MKIPEENIKAILVNESYVSAEDIKKAEAFSVAQHTSFLDYLFLEEIINRTLLGQAIAESFGLSYADFSSFHPPHDQILRIPEEIASKYHVVLFSTDENGASIATDDPKQEHMLDDLKALFPNKQITLLYADTESIEEIFVDYRRSLQARFVEIIKASKSIAPEILDEIISDTISFHASDIHFEPMERDVIIRFRIDGVLHEAGRISKEYYENVLNRIKVQAHLRIDEHKSCQDGAIRMAVNGSNIDIRVSIAPTLDGEKIAMRLMTEYVKGFAIANLGLSPSGQKKLLSAAKKPFGMILVTGPTGSGKTTTLYSLLRILNHPERNITTIEDPVEYKVAGINQIQVDPQAHITFADGLRSIARQDPDIILVGEIRDTETAEIAVNAALTGHLLLSTFHANDAATAIPRLLDMGVEAFLIASSLELIISQRLLRKICENCRMSYAVDRNSLGEFIPNVEKYFPMQTVTLYKGKGCATCNNTGYKGRIAIFEFIQNTPEMQDLILKNPAIKQIWALARKQGSEFLFEDGLEKVRNAVTTLTELLRVAPPPSLIKEINE
jgi:type II secretory ATPase GspE/PulE/Tfp pilus assembly ATPase PilB-like protein